ncbi:hypothetical protein [Gilvimarinus agarilyticus]|uniref:hypothetical protein n=1 Tax=Gilvimarinus agarilyticus TaxID=679259 RepID=UPI000697DAB3|nr:hypothetical protein [Gilvimarinus agarilyticus]
MKRYLAALLTLTLVGCSTSWEADGTQGHYRKVNPDNVSQPSFTRTAYSGDMIVTSWRVAKQKTIVLHEPATISGENSRKVAGVAAVKSFPYTITARPGVGVLVGKDNRYDYYELDQNLRMDYANQYGSKGGVAINRTESREPFRLYWYPDSEPGSIATAPVQNIDYTLGPDGSALREFDGFGQTITYLGMSGGQLNFVYKEYNDDMLRDAFTQEFSYDYQPETEYRYKNAVFVVHSASANQIDYTMVKPFTD